MGVFSQSFEQTTLFAVFWVVIGCNLAKSVAGYSERQATAQNSYFLYQQLEYPKDCKDALNHCSSLNSSAVILIRPTGHLNPFEVYCRNEATSNGWTVILRRLDGSISFNREWTDFKNGFGFPSGEFWIGNDKLSYLTNQGVYELRVDMELSNGSSFYVSYNYFRISDEWSQYAVTSAASYGGDADHAVTYCPLNMTFGTCPCQQTCDNPYNTVACNSACAEMETCICVNGFLKKGDKCVPPNDCGCFVSEINKVIPDGEMHTNDECSLRYTCRNDRLSNDSSYRCSPNAQCIIKDGVRQCYCNGDFEGDGEICNALYTDCFDAYQAGHRDDDVYTILPSGWPGSPFNVLCVMSTNGGGWTVFQRRTDRVTDFYQNWTSYRYGFGSFDGDFWLGNEHLHYLTNQKDYKLRIDIVTSDGSAKYAEYASFLTGNNDNKFRIENIGTFSGTAGHGMRYTNERSFSTYDQDNDECGNHNCAQRHRGAWWYANDWCTHCRSTYCSDFQYSGNCYTECSHSNLNGDYNGGKGENVFWWFHDYDNRNDRDFCYLKFAEMKIRPA